MKDLIEAYLKDHESAWAPSTLKSERSRLTAIADHLEHSPDIVFKYLQSIGQAPYTIKTTFIRIAALEKWANRPPLFQTFLEKHANRFKHAYEPVRTDITYDRALGLIKSNLRGNEAAHALSLLRTGLRISESYQVSEEMVKGKGNKLRKVYGKIESTVPKSTLSRKLKAVGLTPHLLRKLCATRLAEKGASAADLCKIFGWSSITTAYSYLEAREEERLDSLMETATKG